MIDFLLNWGLATKPALLVPIGLVFAGIYYLIFTWTIRYFSIPTIGRYETEEEPKKISADSEVTAYTKQLIIHLGGMENLVDISSCITRLRLTVKEPDRVNEAELKRMGVAGVVKKDASVQVVVGTRAESLANEMKVLVRQTK